MCQCSGISLSVFLNWPSGTEDKRQLQILEQGGSSTISQGLNEWPQSSGADTVTTACFGLHFILEVFSV